MTKTPTMRVDRLLSNLGYGSRREMHALVDAGRVILDGQALTDANARIGIGPDLPARMTVMGKPIDPPPPMIVLMHKPLGVVCSHKEAGERVYDLLPARWQVRDPVLSTVGRLDKDTSGLLLITDDGAFLHRVISPKKHVAKRYVATLDRPLSGEEAALFASGTLMLEGEDKPLLPARLEVLGPNEARLTIEEGRYHQVRRMFAAMGNHVTALHRDRIGGLGDRPADHQIIGAGLHGAGGGHDAALIVAAAAGGADARRHQHEVAAQIGTQHRGLLRRTDHAVEAGLFGQMRQTADLIARRGLDADSAQLFRIHAGQHGHRDQLGPVRQALQRLARSGHHLQPTRGMDIGQPDAQ